MDPVFSIGISSLWDELRHMPAGGVWWVDADRNEDAISLVNQTIASQAGNAKVAVICMGCDPGELIKLDESHGPEKIQLFSMPDSEKGLYFPAICFVLLILHITFSFFFARITPGKIYQGNAFISGWKK